MNRRLLLVSVLLAAGCLSREPPANVPLTLRQVSTTSATIVEMDVGEEQLAITVYKRRQMVEKRSVSISNAQSAELRRLFWRAWRNQPKHEGRPIADGILLEQIWKGPQRSWTVSIAGALTKEDRAAFERVNVLVPEPYRFAVDWGSHQKRAD